MTAYESTTRPVIAGLTRNLKFAIDFRNTPVLSLRVKPAMTWRTLSVMRLQVKPRMTGWGAG